MAYIPSCPVLTFDSIDAIALPRSSTNFRVDVDGLRYDGFLNFRESSTLFVSQHGAADREKLVPPLFARWNFGPLFNAHILCLSDPLLHIAPGLRMAWFIGDAERDATDVVVRIVRRVAAGLGVPERRCIFYSSSSGGFASIMAASRMDGAKVVALWPQADIARYYARVVGDFLRVFGNFSSIGAAQKVFPTRLSAIEALTAMRKEGRKLQMIVAQGVEDQYHLREHFRPLMAAVGGKLEGGVSDDGLITSVLFDHPGGHGKAPVDLDKQLIRTVNDLLESPDGSSPDLAARLGLSCRQTTAGCIAGTGHFGDHANHDR